jgi:hypothetical protein
MLCERADTSADEKVIINDIAHIQAKTNPVVAQIISIVRNGNSADA